MKFKLIKISNLSGAQASIYSILYENESRSLLDIFVENNRISSLSETKNILSRLKVMGNTTGARDHFFRLKEGNPGDGVCALDGPPKKMLRLYCIRYGALLLVVGNGGEKKKGIRTLQEDPQLKMTNYFMRELSKEITERIKEGTIRYSGDFMDFEGDLEFNDNDYELK